MKNIRDTYDDTAALIMQIVHHRSHGTLDREDADIISVKLEEILEMLVPYVERHIEQYGDDDE